MHLQKTWRWFGDDDAVRLSHLKQIGVEGIVTSLHHIKPGVVWSKDDILSVQGKIEEEGMIWSVVESLPVSEDIKRGVTERDNHIDNYKKSLVNLAECGIKTVCYNFMPVLDWVRTDLTYRDSDGTEIMLYDHATFAAFDRFILQRTTALDDYPESIRRRARAIYDSMSNQEREKLAFNTIVLTQGFINSGIDESESYIESFRKGIEYYKDIDKEKYRNHLAYFLNEVVPVAEEHGVRLCIHPDDPPFSILGLPRIVSTIEDFDWIFSTNKSLANGFTFCTGSLAARRDNDLISLVNKFGDRIHFAHLRNLKFLDDGRFYESGHLEGEVDMYRVVSLLLKEQFKRQKEGREDIFIPFRPDHGKKMVDDFQKKSNPGYPLMGRMRGFYEIDGLQNAISRIIMEG